MPPFPHAPLPRTLVVLAALLAAAPATAAPVDHQDDLQIFNRDVFWLDGSTLRNPTAETPLDAQLYSVVGAALPVTWGEFLAAAADARAHCVAGGTRTAVRIRFSGLIPNGVYSVFYGTFQPDSESPLCPGVERTLALPSKDQGQEPDFASFAADEAGEADYQARIEGCLFDAAQLFFSVVYHLDGMTWGELPNRAEYFTQGPDCRSSYGHDAMRHLLILQQW